MVGEKEVRDVLLRTYRQGGLEEPGEKDRAKTSPCQTAILGRNATLPSPAKKVARRKEARRAVVEIKELLKGGRKGGVGR